MLQLGRLEAVGFQSTLEIVGLLQSAVTLSSSGGGGRLRLSSLSLTFPLGLLPTLGLQSNRAFNLLLSVLPTGGGLSREEALAMAQELRTWPLLDGFRGRPKADVPALVDAIVAFSRMASRLGDRLVEAEINPLFVLAKGQGVRAADGVVVLA